MSGLWLQAQRLRTGDWISLIKSAGVEATRNKRQNKVNVELDSKLGTARLRFFRLKFPYKAKSAAAQTEFPPPDASEAERWISGGGG